MKKEKLITKNKITLLIILTIIVLSGIVTIQFKLNLSNSLLNDIGNIGNITLLKEQEVSGLKFQNATLDNNKLTVEITNETEEEYNLKTISVKYLDRTGLEIITVNGYIGNTIIKNDKKQLVVDTDVDLSNAYRIEYIVNK